MLPSSEGNCIAATVYQKQGSVISRGLRPTQLLLDIGRLYKLPQRPPFFLTKVVFLSKRLALCQTDAYKKQIWGREGHWGPQKKGRNALPTHLEDRIGLCEPKFFSKIKRDVYEGSGSHI